MPSIWAAFLPVTVVLKMIDVYEGSVDRLPSGTYGVFQLEKFVDECCVGKQLVFIARFIRNV